MKKPNVTFENGKTIIDGIPAILYINGEGNGVGKLYHNGKKIEGLQEVNLNAKTNDFVKHDIKLVVIKEEQDGEINA